jgi:hypothetical protein
MSGAGRVKTIGGWVLHAAVGGIMLLAGSAKLFGFFPPEELAKYGLGDQVRLIGAGEVLTALLLLVPRTSPLGLLLASAFWGGAICIHMSHGESYVMQSALLVLVWVGAYLRNPAFFAPLFGAAPTAKEEALLAAHPSGD